VYACSCSASREVGDCSDAWTAGCMRVAVLLHVKV
jgi:hypothetical protein